MADYKELVPFILSWEGGFSNRKADRGGATNKGVTIATWRTYCRKKGKIATIDTLKAMTDDEWGEIFKTMFWDRCKADDIADQNIANIMVDWVWASGVHGIKHVQRIVGVKADGIVGPRTLAAINGQGDLTLFGKIKQDRIRFVEGVVRRDATQKVHINGWKNRINHINYGKLILNRCK